jgi:hypothetical protein
MTAGQRLLIQNTLRVLVWMSLVWLLGLTAFTTWSRWEGTRARPYDLNPPTSQQRVFRTMGDTGQILFRSKQAAFFWGPLLLCASAYWARRFLVLNADAEEPPEKEKAES